MSKFINYKIKRKAKLFGEKQDGSYELIATFDDYDVAHKYVEDSKYIGNRKRAGKLFRPGSLLRDYINCAIDAEAPHISEETGCKF